MVVHHAAWVLPIAAPPIRGGWVAVERGRVVALGRDGESPPGEQPAVGSPSPAGAIIMPALVNAHTHLELSYMRGLVPPAESFDVWVRALMSLRRTYPDPLATGIIGAAQDAVAQTRAAGTGLVGDISNTLVTPRILYDLAMPGHVFHEVLGFTLTDGSEAVAMAGRRIEAVQGLDGLDGDVRVTLAAHAPYSVSPALFMSLAEELKGAFTSVHLGESREEMHFLRHGGGPIQAALESIGSWNPAWTPPRCGPVEYVDKFGLLSERMLAVHGVHLSYRELAQLTGAGATLVTCPRSNRQVGAGDPPIERFYASGVRVAIGTDSLASVDDLNVFSEMARMRALAPQVPARAIIESATRHGAEALGFGEDYGTIEPGKRASLIAVRAPDDTADVEEYLLSGIGPEDVHWLSTIEP